MEQVELYKIVFLTRVPAEQVVPVVRVHRVAQAD
jgi:hypothetical protein